MINRTIILFGRLMIITLLGGKVPVVSSFANSPFSILTENNSIRFNNIPKNRTPSKNSFRNNVFYIGCKSLNDPDQQYRAEPNNEMNEKSNKLSDPPTPASSSPPRSRRMFVVASLLAATSTIARYDTVQPNNANAYYEKSYPMELQAVDGDVDSRLRKINQITNIERQKIEAARIWTDNKIISSTLWAGALWLWSGSRSNPVATPLANVLYRKDSEKWLQDRNEGWFAALPWEFLVILACIFLVFGFVFDIFVVFITSSTDPTFDIAATTSSTTALSVQLASVCLIAGGSLELGRIFSGEKQQTKQEGLRSTQLEEEFTIFADKRLIVSTSSTKNVHRSEIIAAFRRYYAKYRVRPEDAQQQPNTITTTNDLENVTDLEIERLIRNWAKYRVSIDMTPAGFFYGVEINRDADVFVTR